MKFSRHARNRCRLYKVSQAEVEEALQSAPQVGTDDQGRPLYDMETRQISIRVVIALARSDLVVTLFEKKP